MDYNRAVVVGRITKDPELKALPSGSSVTSFSVATNSVFKNKAGEKQETTEFHNIVVFGKMAETVALYMKKGCEVLVEGRLQTRDWEKDGHKNYRTEIVASDVKFGAKPGGRTAEQKEELPVIDFEEQKSPKDDLPAIEF